MPAADIDVALSVQELASARAPSQFLAAGPLAQRAAARMVVSRRWTVAVPHGCALRDGSGLSYPGGCPVALLGAVDGGAPDTESDLPGGELIGDRSCVGQRPGKPVELGDHKGVAFSAGPQRFAQAGPVSVGAGQAVIDVNPGWRDTQCPHTVVLGGETRGSGLGRYHPEQPGRKTIPSGPAR